MYIQNSIDLSTTGLTITQPGFYTAILTPATIDTNPMTFPAANLFAGKKIYIQNASPDYPITLAGDVENFSYIQSECLAIFISNGINWCGITTG